jgi:hypothetical protein
MRLQYTRRLPSVDLAAGSWRCRSHCVARPTPVKRSCWVCVGEQPQPGLTLSAGALFGGTLLHDRPAARHLPDARLPAAHPCARLPPLVPARPGGTRSLRRVLPCRPANPPLTLTAYAQVTGRAADAGSPWSQERPRQLAGWLAQGRCPDAGAMPHPGGLQAGRLNISALRTTITPGPTMTRSRGSHRVGTCPG